MKHSNRFFLMRRADDSYYKWSESFSIMFKLETRLDSNYQGMYSKYKANETLLIRNILFVSCSICSDMKTKDKKRKSNERTYKPGSASEKREYRVM